MNKYKFFRVTIAILLMQITISQASAQAPKTVTDYLLSLPTNLFEYVEPGYNKYEKNKPKSRSQIEEYRRIKIVIEDIKNGYLKYKQAPNLDNWVEIALFRKNDGEYLMAINAGLQYKGCDSQLNFIEYQNGKWFDVTKQYAPKLNNFGKLKAKDSIFCYELPREGRKLRLFSKWYDEPEDTLGYFEWDGEKFVRKP